MWMFLWIDFGTRVVLGELMWNLIDVDIFTKSCITIVDIKFVHTFKVVLVWSLTSDIQC